jgi:hypothetical protein
LILSFYQIISEATPGVVFVGGNFHSILWRTRTWSGCLSVAPPPYSVRELQCYLFLCVCFMCGF